MQRREAQLLFFRGGVGHVAWRANNKYFSWRPLFARDGPLIASREVPLQTGGTLNVRVHQSYARRLQDEKIDTEDFGIPTVEDAPGLDVSAMEEVGCSHFLTHDHEGPMLPYVLATVKDQSTGESVNRHNCVIHTLNLFWWGLRGRTLSPEFLAKHPAFETAGTFDSSKFDIYRFPKDVLKLVQDYKERNPIGF
jgi:hypothetical protein